MRLFSARFDWRHQDALPFHIIVAHRNEDTEAFRTRRLTFGFHHWWHGGHGKPWHGSAVPRAPVFISSWKWQLTLWEWHRQNNNDRITDRLKCCVHMRALGNCITHILLHKGYVAFTESELNFFFTLQTVQIWEFNKPRQIDVCSPP